MVTPLASEAGEKSRPKEQKRPRAENSKQPHNLVSQRYLFVFEITTNCGDKKHIEITSYDDKQKSTEGAGETVIPNRGEGSAQLRVGRRGV
jgi:hypothetical protein